jgi:hypothetical protein
MNSAERLSRCSKCHAPFLLCTCMQLGLRTSAAHRDCLQHSSDACTMRSVQQAGARLMIPHHKWGESPACPTVASGNSCLALKTDAMRSVVARQARSTCSRCQYCTILAQNSSTPRAGSASAESYPLSQRAARALLRSAASQQGIAR